jgi:uncharacterized repeat protein (TIGR01451 family)
VLCTPAFGQRQPEGPRIFFGDIAVTGFSGSQLRLPTGRTGEGLRASSERRFIDLEGASVRVFGSLAGRVVWDARLWDAPPKFEVPARLIGQVFGATFDDADPPNLYVTATAAFGLRLVVPDRDGDGMPERVRRGNANAMWMPGQFGTSLGGGPGSIWRIDGRTGAVSLFANVVHEGRANLAPGLGNIAYDVRTKQLYVSDLHTGLIHRFDAQGRDLGAFDHGTSGRRAVGLPPINYDPASRVAITDPQFDSENPNTWGFAPPERQVWGLAVYAGRLYYAVAAGPQVWSVSLRSDGQFADDPRLEIDLGGAFGGLPISDMAFDADGTIYLAQRGGFASAFDDTRFVRSIDARVLRYRRVRPQEPGAPAWERVPEEYAIGFARDFRNAAGGVALGFEDPRRAAGDPRACTAVLWATGDHLRNEPRRRRELEPGGPLVVHGAQANPIALVRPRNEPPWESLFLDYDGKFDDPNVHGHVGVVRVALPLPCLAAPAPQLAYPAIPPVGAPAGGGVVMDGGLIGPMIGELPPGVQPIDLAIKKTVGDVKFDPRTLTFTFTYTLVVTNNGPPFAPGNAITISDPVPAGLTFVSATGPGWTCTPPPPPPLSSGNLTCTYAFGSGVFATGGSLPPLVITVTSTRPGRYENCARVEVAPASGLADTVPGNNRDCAPVTLNYPPNEISVTKGPSHEGQSAQNCGIESVCVFTITITNHSPWPFSGTVAVNENTSVPMTIGSTDLPCSPPPTALPFSCNATVTIPASGSVTYTIVAYLPAGAVPAGTQQSAQNCVGLSSATPLPNFPSVISTPVQNCSQFMACGFQCHMTDQQIAQIKIEKKADSAHCTAGGTCSFTYTVTNTGNTSTSFPITFLAAMPPGAATLVSASPAPWTCLPLSGGQIKCLYPPPIGGGTPIPPGGSISVTVTYQISSTFQGTLTNCTEFFVGQTQVGARASAALQRRLSDRMDIETLRAYLRSRGLAPNPEYTARQPALGPDDKSCASVIVTAPQATQADIAVTKSGLTSPPCDVNHYQFTVNVNNAGTSFNGSGSIVVTDTVPAGMQFTSVTATPAANWSCTPAAPVAPGTTVTCTYTGPNPVAPGSLGTLTFNGQAVVPANPLPPFTNCADVTLAPGAGVSDANAANNNACVTVSKPAECYAGRTQPVTAAPALVPPRPRGPACDPVTTVARGNVCACRYPRMKRLSARACACPRGTRFEPERGCVPVRPRCQPPLVVNPAGTGCVCPPGYIRRGKSCVRAQRPESGPSVIITPQLPLGIPGVVPRPGGGPRPSIPKPEQGPRGGYPVPR